MTLPVAVHRAEVLAGLPHGFLGRRGGVSTGLVAGLNVGLGYSDHEHTKAPFACPVQLRLLARKLDVHAGARALVRGGRFEDDLVAGVDPFR